MKDIETLCREWEESGGYGTRSERMERALRWLPYYTLFCDAAKKRTFEIDDDPNGFVSMLLETGSVRPSDSLLDIGAGMGDNALRFAKGCRSVTALEVNPAGVEMIKSRAGELGIDNIKIVNELWENYSPDEQFDVTFTSMCPVICNMEELLRMESMTRRTCCIITVLPGSYDLHRKAIMNALELHPKGMITNGERYMEILTAMGRKVKLNISETVGKRDMDIETAFKQYTTYLEIFGLTLDKTENFLRDYLEKNSDNGVLHDESKMRLALLTWNTERYLN